MQGATVRDACLGFGSGERGQRQDVCAVEGGRGAAGEGGEGVGRGEEEGGAEAVVGVDSRWGGHFCLFGLWIYFLGLLGG